ncbi:unnamed protein product [Caenorhabditis nigoni]
MGSNFMDYLEFEFWFQRFSAGNFDLNYDRSQDPKYRNITDLPAHIFERICENLEDDYQIRYRIPLRHVCKTFRAIVDSWNPPKLTHIQISFWKSLIFLQLDSCSFYYCEKRKIMMAQIFFRSENYQELAADDLLSVLASPEGFKLELLLINQKIDNRFAQRLFDKSQNLKNIKIEVDTLKLYSFQPVPVNNILNLFQSIKKIYICSHHPVTITQDLIDEINGIEALKNAETVTIDWNFLKLDKELLIPRGLKIPKMTLVYGSSKTRPIEYWIQIVPILLKSSHLKYGQVNIVVTEAGEFEESLTQFGAEKDPENPHMFKYSIPDSDEFFEIKIEKYIF